MGEGVVNQETNRRSVVGERRAIHANTGCRSIYRHGDEGGLQLCDGDGHGNADEELELGEDVVEDEKNAMMESATRKGGLNGERIRANDTRQDWEGHWGG